MKKILIFCIASLMLLTSCENEKEPPSGAGSMPQITLVNDSPSKAFLLIYNNNTRIAGTDMVAPSTSAQAKFMITNINSAGEQVRIQVFKSEESASDTKLYENHLTLYPRVKYTYTVDKDYNVIVIRHY